MVVTTRGSQLGGKVILDDLIIEKYDNFSSHLVYESNDTRELELYDGPIEKLSLPTGFIQASSYLLYFRRIIKINLPFSGQVESAK